jgi:hypothetical protein
MTFNSELRRDDKTGVISARPVSGTFHIGHRVLDSNAAPVIENADAGPVQGSSMTLESRGINAPDATMETGTRTRSKIRDRAIDAVSQIAIHAAVECGLSGADLGSCWDMSERRSRKAVGGGTFHAAYLTMIPPDWQRFAVLVVAGIVRTWQPASRVMLVGLIGGMG